MQAPGWRDHVGSLGRQVGVPVAIAIAVLTAATAAIGIPVRRADGGAGPSFDVTTVEDLADARSELVNNLTAAATLLAETVTVTVLWAAAVAFAAWRTRRPTIPVFIVAAIGGEKLTYLLGSLLVDRPRPEVEALGHVYSTRSFPSGHVGAAITLYGGVLVAWLWHQRHARGRSPHPAVRLVGAALVAVIAAGVGFSRVYRGHHFPTDVAWGSVLGVAWLALAWRLALVPAGNRLRRGCAGERFATGRAAGR